MPDKKYDAVIVGGGHHANILGLYLQKAGLKTAQFERWHEMGGGACGEELPLPGYIMNICAQWTRFYSHPCYDEFKLRDYGLVYNFPEYNEGWAFPDGRYIIGKAVYAVTDPLTGKQEFSNENAKDLVTQFGQFNKSDGEVCEWVIESYDSKWKTAFGKNRFTGPDDWGNGPDQLEQLVIDDPKLAKLAKMTIGEQAVALFKSPEMQTFYMRCHMTSHGMYPSQKCGILWLVHVLGLMFSLEPGAVAVGGTHSITHAMLRAYQDMGGEFFVLNEVEKVLVENGTAKGIRLKDGNEIKADIVISDLNINLTLEILGKENVPDDIWNKVAKFRDRPTEMNDPGPGYERTSIFWGSLAMMEPPKFTCHKDMHLVPRLYFGEEAAEYLLSGRYQKEIWETGMASKTYMCVASADHAYDATRCPPGRYTQMIEEFCWPIWNWPERKWLSMNKVVAERWLKEWARYAPNMTMENLIEAYVTTPDHVFNRNPNMFGGGWGALDCDPQRSGKERPIRELNNYRMPVKNYYLCSSTAHSAHGIGRGSSHNCYKAIAKDLGLKYQPVARSMAGSKDMKGAK
ncbi:MAG: hypothetical protein C0392_13420 [Syntrophus sp. (in: bacteria)]|nr:hypothetical protein [Syntrophus sp. (in: bacteria)]